MALATLTRGAGSPDGPSGSGAGLQQPAQPQASSRQRAAAPPGSPRVPELSTRGSGSARGALVEFGQGGVGQQQPRRRRESEAPTSTRPLLTKTEQHAATQPARRKSIAQETSELLALYHSAKAEGARPAHSLPGRPRPQRRPPRSACRSADLPPGTGFVRSGSGSHLQNSSA